MECPLTVFRSQSTLEGVNKSINNSSPLYCQRAASRRREASWRQPYKAVCGCPRQNESRVDVTKRYRKTSKKKRATWFATLLQNESNGDAKRFNYHPCSNLLTTWFVVRQVWCGWYNAQHRYSTCFETMFFSTCFCNNVAKQVACFLLPVFPYL